MRFAQIGSRLFAWILGPPQHAFLLSEGPKTNVADGMILPGCRITSGYGRLGSAESPKPSSYLRSIRIFFFLFKKKTRQTSHFVSYGLVSKNPLPPSFFSWLPCFPFGISACLRQGRPGTWETPDESTHPIDGGLGPSKSDLTPKVV